MHIRVLEAQAKHEENHSAERQELKNEISDLKSEIRELIRANREQVAKLETLRTEVARIKCHAKVRRPNSLNSSERANGQQDHCHPSLLELSH
jgi:phage host-nuclease inhibitor protein Gam